MKLCLILGKVLLDLLLLLHLLRDRQRLRVEVAHLTLDVGLLLRIIVELGMYMAYIRFLLILLLLVLWIERILIHLRSHKSHFVIHLYLSLHERVLDELVVARRRLILNLNFFIGLAVARILRLSIIYILLI